MSYRVSTIDSEKRMFNNDALAHAQLLFDSYDGQLAKHRIYLEFITDIGERLKQPFKYSFEYRHYNNDLISETGLNLTQMLRNGLIAARNDVGNGSQILYHVKRQENLLKQQEIIMDWHNSTIQDNLLLVSLCPSYDELPTDEAKKQSFKPDRQMASLQLFIKKTDGIIEMQAFSLDNIDIDSLKTLVSSLNGAGDIATNTLGQLLCPIVVHKSITDTEIIDAFDGILFDRKGTPHKQGMDIHKYRTEANTAVINSPEVWDLYWEAISYITDSLKQRAVLKELADFINTKVAYEFVARETVVPEFLILKVGSIFNTALARPIMQYLRSQAIPEYLINKIDNRVAYSDTGSIAGAGFSAYSSGTVHDGSCQTSEVIKNSIATQNNELEAINKIYNRSFSKPNLPNDPNSIDLLNTECPYCCKRVNAPYDSKRGLWLGCGSSSCIAYNSAALNLYNSKFNNQNDNSQDQTAKTKGDMELLESDSKTNRSTHDDLIKSYQDVLWLKKYSFYNNKIDNIEKQKITNDLIKIDNILKYLIRASITGTDLDQSQLQFTTES